MARLFVVAGMPGAGKSTLARRLAAAHGAVHLQTDEWLSAQQLDLLDAPLRRRTERQLWRHGRQLLAAGVDVVLDFGAWSRLERERYRRGAREVGAEVELHCLDVPLEVRVRRVAARGAAGAGRAAGPAGAAPGSRAGVSSHPGAAEPTEAQQRAWAVYWEPADDAELTAYDPPLPM